jgi:1-acyl-sn-glycerol-3-phosphate acyltransferase
MNWVRSGIFLLLMGLNVIVFGTAMLLAWPVASLHGRWRVASNWSKVNRWLLKITCNLREEIQGMDRLPPPPFVLMAKHQSAWETLMFLGIFPPLIWVLKRSLIYIPFFGWALRASNQIFIDRQQGVEAIRLLQQASERMFDQGFALMVFPEGTRVAPGTVGDYKGGGVNIAMAAGIPIVPVAHNAGVYWARRSFLKKPGVIRVKIGPPIPTTNLPKSGRKLLLVQVRDAIEGMMAEIDSSC